MMNIFAKMLAAIVASFAALRASDAIADSGAHEVAPERAGGPANVERHARALADILGLNKARTDWLANMHLAQGNSESGSGMNNLAANKTDSERKASRRLFFAVRGDTSNDKILGGLLGKNISSDGRWYTPGSGGWFGLFAVNLLNVLNGRKAKRGEFGPKWIFDPWASTVGYAAYCDRLTRRSEWSRSTQDARAIKIGGAAGSLMDDPEKERAQKAVANLMKAVSRQKLPSSFPTASPGIRQIYAGRNWLEIYREGVRRGL